MKAVVAILLVLCYLSVTHAWTCKVPPQHHSAVQIDAGMGSVVMRDKDNQTYFLSGSTWEKLGSAKLKHVSVGPAGIWGVSRFGSVHKYVSGNFVRSQGLPMKQVDAGGLGQVVGVMASDSTSYCLRSHEAIAYIENGVFQWISLSRSLIYISCGPLHGCWGTDSANRIYIAPTIVPSNCWYSSWASVDGLAKMVEVGTDGNVFVLNSHGQVFQRLGISSGAPQGTGWSYIPMCATIVHLSYDLGQLWLVTDTGVILRCTQ